MGGFVSSPTTPGGGGWNLSNLFLPLPGVVGGFSWNNPSNQLLMYQSMGVLPPELQNWIRQLPAPEGTPADMLQTTQWGGVGEIPKWFVQRFGDVFGFTESSTQPRTSNSWWMDFLESPWKYLTGPAIATMSQPWQGSTQGTGETPTEGGNPPQGTPESPSEGTGEAPPSTEYPGPAIYTTIDDIIQSNQMSWAEKAAALAAAGVAAAVIPYYIGAEPTFSTTVNPPPEPAAQTQPTPPLVPPPMPWDVTPATTPTIPTTGLPTFYGYGWEQQPVQPVPSQLPWELTPTTTPTIPSSGPGGYYNFTPPTPPVEYHPSPITGVPTPGPVPGVNIPPVSGATTSTPTPKVDLGSLLGGLGGAMAAGGGAGPPGMTAPVVGGGQTQSQFATPFAVAPAPPTLMQFIRALGKGGMF